MKPRAITEGGLLCAIAVLMACLCTYIPFFVIFYIFIPLPIVICAQRQGFVTALIASVAASLIMFFLIDWMTALLYAMYFILVGCSLGWTYAKKKKGIFRVGAAYLAILITLLMSLLILQWTSGVNFIDTLTQELTSVMSEVSTFYQNAGILSSDQLSTLSAAMDTLLSSFKQLIPAAFLLAPALIAWLNVLLCDKMMLRFEAKIEPLKPMSQWRVPKSLAIFMLLLVLGISVIDLFAADAIPEIYTYTILEIIQLIYLVMGISFLFWYFNRKRQKESMGIKCVVLIVICLISVAASIVSFIGIADIYLHLRDSIAMKDGSSKDQ